MTLGIMDTQLQALEQANGATLEFFGQGELPASFADLRTEWEIVRQRCGLLDARFRNLLRLTGSDRITFAQGMFSNDVAGLRDGAGTYAALLTQQGKIVSDLRIYALADELWLDVPAATGEAVRAALERFIVADDVEFAADQTWMPLVALEGPQTAHLLASVTDEALESMPAFTHRVLSVDGSAVRVAAVSHTGESGYLLFGNPAVAAALWKRCRQAGAEPVGMHALDVLRLEAGIPWYGRDMDESMLISEVCLEGAISYTKGCYLGQEVVERVAARGQVQRRLVGLLCDGPEVPPQGSKLMRDDKEVGSITSAAWSPARESVIALGYTRRGCWEPGTDVAIALAANTRVAARIVPLPFYARPA